MNTKDLVLMLSHDVSQEMRDEHGRWSGGGKGVSKSKNKSKISKTHKEKPLSKKEWHEMSKREKAIVIGGNSALIGLTGAAIHYTSRQKPPNKQLSIHEVNKHFEKLSKLHDEKLQLKNAAKLHKMLARGKRYHRNQAIKSSVRTGTRKSIRGLLHLGVLVKYHAQKAINKFGRPQKIAGLLTHIK